MNLDDLWFLTFYCNELLTFGAEIDVTQSWPLPTADFGLVIASKNWFTQGSR